MKFLHCSVERGGWCQVMVDGKAYKYSAEVFKRYQDREVIEILLHSATLFIWLADEPAKNIKQKKENELW